jgi:hypothetical protein
MAPEDVRKHARRVSRITSLISTVAQAVVLWIDFRGKKREHTD